MLDFAMHSSRALVCDMSRRLGMVLCRSRGSEQQVTCRMPARLSGHCPAVHAAQPIGRRAIRIKGEPTLDQTLKLRKYKGARLQCCFSCCNLDFALVAH